MTIEQINHTGAICDEVFKERVHQDEKWDKQNQTLGQYALILHEEVGEVAKVIRDTTFTDSENAYFARMQNLRRELIKVASVAIAMVESLDKNELRSGSAFEHSLILEDNI